MRNKNCYIYKKIIIIIVFMKIVIIVFMKIRIK